MSSEKDFVIKNGVLKKYKGSGGDVIIPEVVTTIDYRAFSNCSHLTSVTIPEGVTTIGACAFSGCNSLTSVTISNRDTNIDSSAFLRCKGLADKDGLVVVAGHLFGYYGTAKELTIPGSVTTIDYRAFSDCSHLTSVTIPEGVTTIGDGAFSECSRLTSVTIPDSVTTIGGDAFWGCSSLTSVTIPVGITVVNHNVFSGCSSLTSVTIPEGVTTIGDGAFSGCSKLTSAAIPESVTTIGERAFSWCRNLTSVAIPEGVTTIGDEAFSECSRLTSVTIPGSVTTIGDNVFSRCRNLKSITLPKKFVIKPDLFAWDFPSGLLGQIRELYPMMNPAAIKNFLMDKAVWSNLDFDVQLGIFMSKQNKALTQGYMELIRDYNAFGNALLEKLKNNPSAKDCNSVAAFMILFLRQADSDLLHVLYSALKSIKTAAKALKTIEAEAELMEKLNMKEQTKTTFSPLEEKVYQLMKDSDRMFRDLENDFKKYYSLTSKDLPTVNNRNKSPVSPNVLMWLLMVHETLQAYEYGTPNVVAGYENPGICQEAAEIVAELDSDSFQSSLRTLAENNLGIAGRSKKMFLAYPICRYANEKLMNELTTTAPKWQSSTSGEHAPPYATFCEAYAYSETKAARMFAAKMGTDMQEHYAKLHGITSDALWNLILDDLGLDASGVKVYDLGDTSAAIRLQPDLTYVIELPNGKTAKSLPKKGADAEKHAAATEDFKFVKKMTKEIVKERMAQFLQAFLSGEEQSAESWKNSYGTNPVMGLAASLIVWQQSTETFKPEGSALLRSDGSEYTLGSDPVKVAHPMEMDAADLAAWQRYFAAHNLKQPFSQIWEPVIDPTTISEGRYQDCMIPLYRFLKMEKHGIYVTDEDFHSEIYVELDGCNADVERIDWERHTLDPNHRFRINSISFGAYTRQTNHIIAYLDQITVNGRILRDDVTIADNLPQFTLAQITEFIKLATENNCTNVTALLLDYKQKTFSDFDPMEEFMLE